MRLDKALPWLAAAMLCLAVLGCVSPAERDVEAGVSALRSGDNVRAEDMLTRALDSGTLSEAMASRALHHRALSRLSRGLFSQAEADAGAALSMSLRRSDTYLVRGMARLGMNDSCRAEDDFGAALAIEPGNAAALTYRGQVRLERGDVQAALDDLGKAVDRPGLDRSLLGRGLLLRAEALLRLERQDQALADLERAMRAVPGGDLHLACRLLRAKVRMNSRQYGLAVADYDRVLEMRPTLAEALLGRGNALYAQERYDRAAADFAKGLESAPDSPQMLNQLAWLLATAPDPAVRDGRRAVSLAQKAVDLSGDNAMYVDTLAAALAEAGQFREAAQAQETALMILEQTGPAGQEPDFRARLELYRHGRAWREKPRF